MHCIDKWSILGFWLTLEDYSEALTKAAIDNCQRMNTANSEESQKEKANSQQNGSNFFMSQK